MPGALIPRQGGAMLNAGPGVGRRSGRWTRIASALVPAVGTLLFGAALFVALFGPKGGPTGARSAITRPALVRIVSSEERPTNLDVDVSSVAIPTLAPSEPAPTSVESPASADATSGPVVSQSTESNPLRTASGPPDAPAPSATLASEAAPLDALQRPAEAALKVEGKVVVSAQPRTPNLGRIAKLSRRLAVNVTVAKTTAPAPRARAEMLRQPQHPGASTIQQAPTEPHTIAASASAQEPVNPTTHVFGAQTGVLGRSAVETATKSGDWAVQFAEPKSEVEAKVAAARLNAKYAPALNGATIDVRKTQVNGATIYALRVAGLSKADAMVLCVRVKGRDCSIIK